MNKIYSTIFCLITFCNCFAQNYKHQIVNKDNEGIGYATISTDNYFSITDVQGYFLIPESVKSIKVSCVGYLTKNFNINSTTKTLELEPTIYLLNEVRVQPIDFKTLHNRFLNKFDENIEDKPYDSRFFYREFTTLNGIYIDFNEGYGKYHFEGFSFSRIGNIHNTSSIFTLDQVRSLNILQDKKLGLHEVNWLSAANNVSNNLLVYLSSFVGDLTNRKIENIIEANEEQIIEVSIEPNPDKLVNLISRQWRRGIFYAGILASSSHFFFNETNGKLQKIEFSTDNFNKSLKGYNSMDDKFKVIKISGVINFINDKNDKTIPAFIGCKVSYVVKDNPNQIINKSLEFYFTDFDFEKQTNLDLERKYESKISGLFPTRAIYYDASKIYPGKAIYDADFWSKEISYPQFYDIIKVKKDLENQGVSMNEKFLEFNNNYK